MLRPSGVPAPPTSRDEYAKLARDYDRRWRRYLERTTQATLTDLDLVPDEQLLDVGCGTGYLLEQALHREPRLRLVGIDLSLEMLSVARERLGPDSRLIQAEVERLPFRGASFDIAVSCSSLHYWHNPEEGIAEIGRVLRPGATLVVTDWTADSRLVRAMGWLLRQTGRPLGAIQSASELSALLRRHSLDPVRIEHHAVGWPWRVHRVVAIRK